MQEHNVVVISDMHVLSFLTKEVGALIELVYESMIIVKFLSC
jgi:hypothetical protein